MPRIINGPHKGQVTKDRRGEICRSLHHRPLIAVYRRRQDMDYEYVETVHEDVYLRPCLPRVAAT